MIISGIGRTSMLASLAVAFAASVTWATEVREILPDTVFIGSAIVSGDGSRVAFTRSDGLSMQVFLASTDGSEIRQLTQFVDSAPLRLESISELGNSVAFTKPVSGVTQIFIATEAGYVSQLTSRSRPSTQPRLNADGSRIFFQRDSLNAPGVYVMDGFGGGAELVSSSPGFVDVDLGNTGQAGDRIGGTVTTRVGDVGAIFPVSIERDGTDLPLWTLGVGLDPPRLSADEQWFVSATALGPNLATLQVSRRDLSSSWLLEVQALSLRVLGISNDGSRLLVNIDGSIQYTPAVEYVPTPAIDFPYPVSSVTASYDLSVLAASRRQGNSNLGLWVVLHSPARVETPRDVFGMDTIPIGFVSVPDRNREYIAAASSGTSPGTRLGDGRVVPLNSTRLAFLSSRPSSPNFVGFRGRLDATGRASGEIREVVRHLRIERSIYLAFVVLDPQAPLGIVRISEAARIHLAPAEG